jgi:hypothetical protein
MRRDPTLLKVATVGMGCWLITTKAILVRLKALPLRTDPCDAVGAFAVMTVVVIAAGNLLRRLPGRADARPRAQKVYRLRSLQAIVIGTMALLVSDVVALVRQSFLWVHGAYRGQIPAVLGLLAAVAIGAQLLIRAAGPNPLPVGVTWPKRGGVLAILAIVSLVICPAWPTDRNSEIAHIGTVTLGALVLFVPMRFLVAELVPFATEEDGEIRAPKHSPALLICGLAFGAFGFWAETMELGTAVRHVAGVALVVAATLVGYASLAAPLGFVVNRNRTIERVRLGR